MSKFSVWSVFATIEQIVSNVTLCWQLSAHAVQAVNYLQLVHMQMDCSACYLGRWLLLLLLLRVVAIAIGMLLLAGTITIH